MTCFMNMLTTKNDYNEKSKVMQPAWALLRTRSIFAILH